MEEIPTLVEGHAEVLEPGLFGFGDLSAPLPFPQLVLLVRDLVDPSEDLIVFHLSLLGCRSLAVALRLSLLGCRSFACGDASLDRLGRRGIVSNMCSSLWGSPISTCARPSP